MKIIVGVTLFSLMLCLSQADDFYGIPLKNLDGNKIELASFRGKKVLFILLPMSDQDTAVRISDISHLQTTYQKTLVIIGVPSVEAGYKSGDANKWKKTFRDAGANFVIAEGMKVTKGDRQSPLFEWLTNKAMNHHFDRNVQGAGSKCFVDESGELYAVIGPKLALTDPLVDRILGRAVSQNKKQKKN